MEGVTDYYALKLGLVDLKSNTKFDKMYFMADGSIRLILLFLLLIKTKSISTGSLRSFYNKKNCLSQQVLLRQELTVDSWITTTLTTCVNIQDHVQLCKRMEQIIT